MKESYEDTMKELEGIMHHACASCNTRLSFSDLDDEEVVDWCESPDYQCDIFNAYGHMCRIIEFVSLDVPMLLQTCKRYEEVLRGLLPEPKFDKLVRDIVHECAMMDIEQMPEGEDKDFFKDLLAGSIQHGIDREQEEGDPDVFEF